MGGYRRPPPHQAEEPQAGYVGKSAASDVDNVTDCSRDRASEDEFLFGPEHEGASRSWCEQRMRPGLKSGEVVSRSTDRAGFVNAETLEGPVSGSIRLFRISFAVLKLGTHHC